MVALAVAPEDTRVPGVAAVADVGPFFAPDDVENASGFGDNCRPAVERSGYTMLFTCLKIKFALCCPADWWPGM